jgi:flavin reductase (DIM6/NTAB) family NADH-FMN oxidoreductase RutF
VVAVPGVELAPKIVQVGNCSGRDVDKFETIGLTPLPAARVAAPLVAECFANLECKVVDTRFVNKYGIFILEVVQAWAASAWAKSKTIHHQGYGKFIVDGETLRLQSKMR